MDVGIGLPGGIPGTDGKTLVEWARHADGTGLSTLGTIDRLVYPNYDPFISLAAAAVVTERIGLMTTVLLGPLRPNAISVAKEALSLDRLSNGRFSLGIGLGARGDDYEASGIPTGNRGKVFDRQLEEIKSVFAGEKKGLKGPVGPPPVREGGPELIVGGGVDASFKRAARFGDGWIMSGGTPDQFSEMGGKADEAWKEAGRSDTPRKLSLAYFSLGPNAEQNADNYIHDYYSWLGDDVAGMIASSAAKDEDTVKSYISGFADAGCDELIFFPCSSDVEQVELLASAAGVPSREVAAR
jgi:alkanesulfonate monooxygenase SsuD/methylene tetrahydromethanopterin reductase-like flavin-dependent oxidoreductase (luciferase family)